MLERIGWITDISVRILVIIAWARAITVVEECLYDD